MGVCSQELLDTIHVEGSTGSFDLERLAPLILKPHAVGLTANCRRHGRRCSYPRASLHSSGCPCTDFTSWGKCRRPKGPTVPCYLVWIAMRRALLEPLLVFENVIGFPIELLRMYLHEFYDFHSLELCCTVLGCAVRRPRLFVIGTLRTTVRLCRDLGEPPEASKRARHEDFTWRNYCVATETELLCELRWARARKGINTVVTPISTGSFKDALLESEQSRLDILKSKYSIDRCVANLCQDPDFCRTASM